MNDELEKVKRALAKAKGRLRAPVGGDYAKTMVNVAIIQLIEATEVLIEEFAVEFPDE